MGLNSENAARLVFDIETAPLPEAAEYLTEPIEAPSNWKDPEKIAGYVAKGKADQLEKCGLDVDLCQVVAICYHDEGDPESQALLAVGGSGWSESGILRAFWAIAAGRHLVGFNCLGFDLPVLLRRSLYLGVPAPSIQIDKYRHPNVSDLMQMLSFNGALKFRSLSFYSKRFGLDVADSLTGADIAKAVTEGRWSDVEAHVKADVKRTALLASKLGLFTLSASRAVAEVL